MAARGRCRFKARLSSPADNKRPESLSPGPSAPASVTRPRLQRRATPRPGTRRAHPGGCQQPGRARPAALASMSRPAMKWPRRVVIRSGLSPSSGPVGGWWAVTTPAWSSSADHDRRANRPTLGRTAHLPARWRPLHRDGGQRRLRQASGLVLQPSGEPGRYRRDGERGLQDRRGHR